MTDPIADPSDKTAATKDQETFEDFEGWWDSLKSKVGNTVDHGKRAMDIASKLDEVKLAAMQIIDRIIDLIVVFVLSTIVLPLLFLWGFFKLGGLMISRGTQFFSANEGQE